MRRDRTGARGSTRGERPPRIDAPSALAALELDVDGERFAVLEWPTASSPPAPAALTPAEAEVAALAAAGLSNAEIGASRGAAARTVANQLARAFRKLGVRSRAELCVRLSCGRPRSGGRR
jgi:DNA-binding CsgD family transcriptional regulator